MTDSCGVETAGKSIFTLFIEATLNCPKEMWLYWSFPLAIIVGIFIAYMVSAIVEHRILNRFFPVPRKVVYITNAISYEALIGLAVTLLVLKLI